MADLYGIGRAAGELPGRIGTGLRRAPGAIARAMMVPFEHARQLGAGLGEGAREFGAGVAGLPSRADMQQQIDSVFKAPTSIREAVQLLDTGGPDGASEPPMPNFDDVESGGSAGGIRAALARDPQFRDVRGGGSSTAEASRILREAPRDGESSSIRYAIGGGPLKEYGDGDRAPLAPGAGRAYDPIDRRVESYQPAAGGGTVSMMTAPENAQRVTIASAIEDAANESALREARGEPSPSQIFQAENQARLRYRPEDELNYSRAEATNRELEALNGLSRQLAQAVQEGRVSQEMAQAQFEQARQSAAFRLQAVQGGSLGAWGPNKQDDFAGGGLAGRPPGA